MEVVFRYSSIDSTDGRLKKLRVFAARPDFDQLKDDGADDLLE